MSKLSLRKRQAPHHITSTRPAFDLAGLDRMEVVSMASATLATPTRYLSNEEAAAFLKLSPRTLEKHRVIGGGPRFRKFGRRVVYAIDDLENWSNERVCTSTSDTHYRLTR